MKNKVLMMFALILMITVVAFLSLSALIRNNKVTSISIRVVGQSIIGEKYNKNLNVTKTNNEFYLTYECTSKDSTKYCKCSDVTKLVTDEDVNALLTQIKTLSDGGESAKCCDHPWTEIEVRYANSTVQRLTVIMEPIDIEKLFNINCN